MPALGAEGRHLQGRKLVWGGREYGALRLGTPSPHPDTASSTLTMRFDAKMLNAVAKLIGQGDEWPTDGTAHLGRDAWELAKERLRIPKRLGGLDVKMPRG